MGGGGGSAVASLGVASSVERSGAWEEEEAESVGALMGGETSGGVVAAISTGSASRASKASSASRA